MFITIANTSPNPEVNERTIPIIIPEIAFNGIMYRFADTLLEFHNHINPKIKITLKKVKRIFPLSIILQSPPII